MSTEKAPVVANVVVEVEGVKELMETRKRSRKWFTAKWGMVVASALMANFITQSWVQPEFDNAVWWVAVALVGGVIGIYGGANALATLAEKPKP